VWWPDVDYHAPEKEFLMIRLAVVTVGAFLAFCPFANAQTVLKSADGTMQLTLPNGWKEGKGGGANSEIRAMDGRGAFVAVNTQPKEDFKDFKAFANFSLERMKKAIPDTEPKTQDVQIDGKPAIRMTMSGAAANGKNESFIITCIESDATYVAVLVRASASNYQKQEPVLTGLANQLKISAAPATAQPQPATSTKPPPGPPASRPPH
jgi:hypothetical protein